MSGAADESVDLSSCAICCEDLLCDLQSTPCGHVFHSFCILQALAIKSHCPICRSPCQSDSRCKNAPIKLFLEYKKNKAADYETVHSTEDWSELRSAFLDIKEKFARSETVLKETQGKLDDTLSKLKELREKYGSAKGTIAQLRKDIEEKSKLCEQLQYSSKKKKEELEKSKEENKDLQVKLTSYEIAGILMVGKDSDANYVMNSVQGLIQSSQSNAIKSLKEVIEYQSREYRRLASSYEEAQRTNEKLVQEVKKPRQTGLFTTSGMSKKFHLDDEAVFDGESFPSFVSENPKKRQVQHYEASDNQNESLLEEPTPFRICSAHEESRKFNSSSFPLGRNSLSAHHDKSARGSLISVGCDGQGGRAKILMSSKQGPMLLESSNTVCLQISLTFLIVISPLVAQHTIMKIERRGFFYSRRLY